MPGLQVVTVAELESLSDDTYIKLRKNELKLLNWGKSNAALLNTICTTIE